MKVVAVLGSPRAESRSTALTRRILDGAKAAGHEVVIYDIPKMNVQGCQGCRYCKSNGVDCILEDDLKPYWKDLHECGALIVSAPNYCSQVCGPMITYMNRHYCILDGQWQTRLTPGKIKLIGVFAQAQPESSTQAHAAFDWYLGDFLNRKMVLADKFIIGGDSDLSPDGTLMQRAYALGLSL